MLCSICNKNPATIHIQEIINGGKKTIHICQSCAVAKGLNVLDPEEMNFTEFLCNISSGDAKESQSAVIDENEIETANILTCSKCVWDSEKMKKTGRLGCPECYNTFKDKLAGSLAVMHRGIIHCGKIPSTVGGERCKRNIFMGKFLIHLALAKLGSPGQR